MMPTHIDIAIVGAGAAGLMTAIWAGRQNPQRQIILLDGARKLGAKILVAGGGRCNVTHDVIDEADYAGSSRKAIRKVLRRFDVPQTIAFFAELGVALKREDGGKLFPVTDSARTVLDALLNAVRACPNVRIWHPNRVEMVSKRPDGVFELAGPWGTLTADKLVLATGGKSIPKSGSDGKGYELVSGLGHGLTPHIFPALVPLKLPKDHFICSLSGITLPATFELWTGSGKRLESYRNSTLCTHFGLSGPAVLDISRYYTAALLEDPAVVLTMNWLPEMSSESFEQWLLDEHKRTAVQLLRQELPDRVAQALCTAAGIPLDQFANQLTRPQRKTLVQIVTRYPLPITGDRGYNYAEVTAGGVPLTEIELKTMHSRKCENLYLCGEICDVDGRIGGFNFQWAWASGYVVGISV